MRPTRSCEVYIDGASRGNPGPSGIGAAFFEASPASGKPECVKRFSKYIGVTTNNVAEYLGLIYALQEALRDGYRVVSVKSDSQLLVRQIEGQYQVKNSQLRLFHDFAQHVIGAFEAVSIAHIPREQNTLADRLAGQAIHSAARNVFK